MAELKTAKDMPEGSEVDHRGTVWRKTRLGVGSNWTNAADATRCLADGDIDLLLGGGAHIAFMPCGRGRWLRQQREQREALSRG